MSHLDVQTIEIAKTFEDRRKAFSLIGAAYVRAGLADERNCELRVTRHQLLADSRVFVAKLGNEVVSTLSLIQDSDQGLPLELIYPDEVNLLRSRGLRIAEVGCFADRRNSTSRFLENFCQLTRLMVHYSKMVGIDGFIIAVHPRHAKFYQNFLCFQEIGGRVDYPSVKNRPAVALFLDFARAKVENADKYEKFFGGEVAPVHELRGGEIPAWEVSYFLNHGTNLAEVREVEVAPNSTTLACVA